MEMRSVERPEAEIMDAISMIIIKFGKFFGK